ncbi:hypothetical protein L2449_20035 [Mesorhizobium muleiense]|uniref:hypothetical protein n=1 Tax=Mesorhizobium muleiense TaxID=1004279 RepID=UPI001F19B88B|nr:hypothetical protein [Mesorhizobium muleiense]MCF6119146.1 hypothetical protein [Mesorhizobium muleiense]
MNIETNRKHTAKDLVHEAVHKTQVGGTVSVKAVIAAVRQDGPHFEITDSALIELIVEAAPACGRAVAFDLHDE